MAEIKKTDRLSIEFIDWYYPGLKSGGPVISLHNELIANKNVSNSIVFTRNKDIDGKIYDKNEIDDVDNNDNKKNDNENDNENDNNENVDITDINADININTNTHNTHGTYAVAHDTQGQDCSARHLELSVGGRSRSLEGAFALHQHRVGFGDAELRACEQLAERAVVCQQQQPLAVKV